MIGFVKIFIYTNMSSFSLKRLSTEQKEIRRKIITYSYLSNLTHIGSCLSAVDLIDSVYKIKHPEDKFVLSNGHSGVALYFVLHKYGHIPNEKIIQKLFIHPDRNQKLGIHVSTGSLGQGLPIAVGMALADKKKTIYCLLSDGECAEGSIWESIRVASDNKINNLKIIVNANGWGAYDPIEKHKLKKRLRAFDTKVVNIQGHYTKDIIKGLKTKTNKLLVLFANTASDQFTFLTGQDAHYYKMKEKDYQQAMKLLA